MTPLETLKAARGLISNPARWTQGDYAKNKNGNRVDAISEEAVCFCAEGAIYKVTGYVSFTDAESHLIDVCFQKFNQGLISYNDTHAHAEVLALFDAAIAELEAKP